MTAKERFLKYVTIDTQSSPVTGEHPSTRKQFDLARVLVEELKELGIDNARLDEEHCYVYAYIPENVEGRNSIGFIAHMDTEPVCSGKNVKPQVFIYEGGDIVLNNGVKISESDFPALRLLKGQELITTDGTTLLGADDKAGVAEIMAAVEHIVKHPELPHGKIGIAFTPDEEIGEGPMFFDVENFDCDFAYTVDGGFIGDFGYETFNAAEAEITFKGLNIHPGAAKGKMKNCVLMMNDFINLLPDGETPDKTEGREGFYHIEKADAEVEHGKILMIIRDHDSKNFQRRKDYIKYAVAGINEKYGEGSAEGVIRDQYRNCRDVIKEHFHLVTNAEKAMKRAGVTAFTYPVRGGTDGCTLSFMGLPCPNLFTGGLNAHSVKEFIPSHALDKAVQVILNIIDIYSDKKY